MSKRKNISIDLLANLSIKSSPGTENIVSTRIGKRLRTDSPERIYTCDIHENDRTICDIYDCDGKTHMIIQQSLESRSLESRSLESPSKNISYCN